MRVDGRSGEGGKERERGNEKQRTKRGMNEEERARWIVTNPVLTSPPLPPDLLLLRLLCSSVLLSFTRTHAAHTSPVRCHLSFPMPPTPTPQTAPPYTRLNNMTFFIVDGGGGGRRRRISLLHATSHHIMQRYFSLSLSLSLVRVEERAPLRE